MLSSNKWEFITCDTWLFYYFNLIDKQKETSMQSVGNLTLS